MNAKPIFYEIYRHKSDVPLLSCRASSVRGGVVRVFRACVLADFDCPCKFYPPPHLNNEHLKNYFVNCLMKKRAKV